MVENTFPQLLLRNYREYGTRKVAMYKREFGIWRGHTWADFYSNVKHFSLGLLSIGLKPDDKVAIIGANDPQWFWAEVAVQAAGAVPLGIYTDSVISEVKYVLAHSDAKFVVARDQEQVDKILALKDELRSLQRVIYWEPKGLWNYDEPFLLEFGAVLDKGRQFDQSHPDNFEANIGNGKGKDTAVLLYTSGTSALPKGAIVSHTALIDGAQNWAKIEGVTKDYQYLSSIPPAWAFEQMFGIGALLSSGIIANFPEKPETVAANTREVAPEIMINPPRVWEMLTRRVQAMIFDANILKRITYRIFLPVGYKVADFFYQKRRPTMFWRILYRLGDWTVFRPVKDKLGILNVKMGMTGGAALSPDVFKFLRAFGLDLLQGYGTTEGGYISIHRHGNVEFETVGNPMPKGEVRISDSGEIIVRNASMFDGYYKDLEASRKAVTDGWFHTGDAGHFQENGHLVILDRLADLVELADGGKFSPGFIENRLKFSPYIKDSMAIGGRDVPYVTCMVIIDFDNVSRWAERNKIPFTTFADLSQKPEIIGLIADAITRVNRGLPMMARVKEFINLHKEFDPDEAELTRTMKLRRGFMEKNYSNLISGLYDDSPAIKTEFEIRYTDGRIGRSELVIQKRKIG